MTNWKRIRLELGQTKDFPTGSVGRGYLVQLPVDSEGRIDEAALALKPHRATVKRYWSTEPDEGGVVVAARDRLTMRCNGGGERAVLLDGLRIRLGEQITVLEPDGGALPFRIASIR